MYYYKLYGLTIAAPIQFPEVPEIEKPQNYDAIMTFSAPPDWVIQQYQEGRFASITQDTMWFRLNDEVLIYVEKGRDIRILKLDENISETRLNTYILSGAITFLLLQRNYLLIHGSALAYKDKVYIISGPSGSGKSTTALELLQKPEVRFASDDICAIKLIDKEAVLYPGPPWQRVCGDVAERYYQYDFTPIEEQGIKYGRRLYSDYLTVPTVVDGMFVINKEHCDEPRLLSLIGEAKFQTLTHNLFRGELHHVLGINHEKVMQLFTLTNSFPVYMLKRPDDKNSLSEITRLIWEQITKIT